MKDNIAKRQTKQTVNINGILVLKSQNFYIDSTTVCTLLLLVCYK